jgi:AmmeMemoRadiSam system protein B
VAGRWYPGTASALAAEVAGYLDAVDVCGDGCPRAIVAPHAGLMYSGPVAAHAYRQLASCAYSAAVLVGPSHFVGFDGVALWPRGAWATPLGNVAVAETLAVAIARHAPLVTIDRAPHRREHSLEMQLPFVRQLLPDVPIVPMVMGHQTRATAEALGNIIADAVSGFEAAAGGRVVLIASSDLSHYLDARTAARMDRVILDCVDRFDPEQLMAVLERQPHHACGGGPIVSVLRAARQLGASRARVLHYGDSGDVSGDKSSVVGYMAAGIW